MATQQKIQVYIRWMICRDMPEVMQIENSSFEFTWSEDYFIKVLRRRNRIGMVAEYENQVVGFMIYDLNCKRIHVLNFAVLPEFRRLGVGKQMVERLISKLSAHRWNRILLEVRETNLPAQLFFRNCGFRAIKTIHDYYRGTPEDAYVMRYRFGDKSHLAPLPKAISAQLG